MNKRMVSVTLLTAGTIALGVGTAFASASHTFSQSTTGAKFTNGVSYFHSPGDDNGAWEYWGDLVDTANDGHTPYMHTKIDGYAWNTEYGTTNGTLYQDHAWYAPGDAYVEVAYATPCNDNGSLDPDNCAPTDSWTYNGS